MIQASTYSTANVNARDRFAFWRDAVCDSFVQLGCDAPQTHDFNGTLSIARYSVLAISEVGGAAHTVVRRKRDIRGASGEYFIVSLQHENTSRITQFHNQSLLRPGDMAVYDSAHPYLLELSEDFSKTVLQLPKDRLLERLPMAHTMGGTRIDGHSGIGKLVRENILAFSQHMQSSDGEVAEMLQNTLIDLVATGMASGLGTQANLSSPKQHVMMRARSFIAANICDPELDRTAVAAHVGLSVRRLNGVFAETGSSIAEEIRRKRLDAVAARLRDPRYAGLSISEVAMCCGYNNLQHFSNAFKTAFGATPRTWRSGKGS